LTVDGEIERRVVGLRCGGGHGMRKEGKWRRKRARGNWVEIRKWKS
jgi:hypothetical protein